MDPAAMLDFITDDGMTRAGFNTKGTELTKVF